MASARRCLAVLADDLTGAADAAAPFAARGFDVAVELSGGTPDAEVLAVLTDNRWRPAAEAAQRMRAAVERLRTWGPDLLFVKIDSTLRGRVRDDVAVALEAWQPAGAVATPAFPAQGRVVKGGALIVHGEATVADVRERFPADVQVLDAQTDDDLANIARRILDEGAVAIGSGGLSAALAHALAARTARSGEPGGPSSNVLLVAGSPHEVTRAQAARALAAGAVAAAGVDAAVAALAAGRNVVLTCDVDGHVEPDSPQAARLAVQLAATVRRIVDGAPGIGLVLTGGATALAVATALGANEFRIRSEVAPGLPRGELVIGDRLIPTVTKSGGFGAEDALVRAAESLSARSGKDTA